MYRPDPLTASVWMPPDPVVVVEIVVHVLPLAEVWIWKDFAYAASQLSETELIVAVAPRSTCSHCGSANALDQRVPVLPSTAALAGVPAFSVLDAVAVRPCDSRVSAACAEVTVSAAY